MNRFSRAMFVALACLSLVICTKASYGAVEVTVPIVPIHHENAFTFSQIGNQAQSYSDTIQFAFPPGFTGKPADCMKSGPTCTLVASNITATYDPIKLSIQNAPSTVESDISYNVLVEYGFYHAYDPANPLEKPQSLTLGGAGTNYPTPTYGCTGGCSTTLTATRQQNYPHSVYAVLDGAVYQIRISAGLGGTVLRNVTTGSATIGVTISGTATFLVPDGPPAVTLIDPAFGLVDGTKVTTSRTRLASGGRIVKGLVADGTAYLVLRIGASYSGENFVVQLPGDASISAIETPSAPSKDGGITVIATSSPPYFAYVLIRAPADFVTVGGGDQSQQTSRQIAGTVQSLTTKLSTAVSIKILRPPVVLIHGIWIDAGTWKNFTPLVTSNIFETYTFDYKKTNGAAFSTNASKFATYLQTTLQNFASSHSVATSAADIVAHSMGGAITRSLSTTSGFPGWAYGHYFVHKLITIGTPHQGSPLAAELLKPGNACLAAWMDTVGDEVNGGAVNDLQEDSMAQRKFQSFPTARLAGRLADSQIVGMGDKARAAIDIFCKNTPDLVPYLAPGNYGVIMRFQPHDGIVPVKSALDNKVGYVWGDGIALGAIHSPTVALLGFTPIPYLLEGDGLVAKKTIDLLNTPVTDGDYTQ